MAHISIDLPSISSNQKKRLISEMQNLLSEIAEINVNEISVSLHELPVENMNGNSLRQESKTEIKEQKKIEEKEVKKKSFFKEMFP